MSPPRKLLAHGTFSRYLRVWLPAALLVAAPSVRLAGAPIENAFDGPEPSWRLSQGAGVRLIKQQRMRIDRDGQPNGVEWLRYACRAGYTGVCWRPIGRAPVLDEFAASLAVRCQAPGAVLAARVVFPRSLDPKTGEPKTALLRGDRYESPGGWQTLRLADAPRQTAGAARLLRTEPGAPPIDEQGAFIDRLVLLLPGAASPISAWIDDLRVEGVLLEAATSPASELVQLPTANSPRVPRAERVTLNAAGFAIGDRPFFPRVWSHAGGSPRVIRESGFNTIAFDQTPTTEQLAEAAKQKLRVICPPPEADHIAAADWAPVLAWRVGGGSLDAARAFAERIRRVDLALERPLIAKVDRDWSAWSRVVDGIVLARVGPRTAAADRLWEERVQGVSRLARPGTPIVQQVFVSPSAETSEQLAAFGGIGPERGADNDRRVSNDVLSAIANQAAGVWFVGRRRLSGADAATVWQRRGLTLLNLRLDLIDPWLAGGARGPLVYDTIGVARGVLLQRGSVRLVTPLPGVEAVPAGAPLVTPGGGDSTQAYRLTPAGLTPLRVGRVAGGATIDADAVGDWGMALVTGDRSAVSAIARRVAKTAKRAVDLQLRLARNDLLRFSQSEATNRGLNKTGNSVGSVRRDAERSISLANAAAAAGKLGQAFAAASSARDKLADATSQSTAHDAPLLRTPLAFTPTSDGLSNELARLLAGAPRGANLLAGGDFEDLDATRRAGWTNATVPIDGVDAGVELSTRSPGHGRRALRLAVGVEQGAALPLAAGDCPVWVTSPATKLTAGQLVEVIGWVRLEQETTTDHPPRLIISDSIGGEQLGRVVDHAETWRPFRLLRRAPRDAELRVTFGLSGVGAALVDAVMVRPVQVGVSPTPPVRLSPAAPVAVQPGVVQPK